MPKKSAATRGGAQRSKPKAQKSFELVRPVTEESEPEVQETQEAQEAGVQSIAELAAANVSTTTTPTSAIPTDPPVAPATATPSRKRPVSTTSAEPAPVVESVVEEPVGVTPAPKASGSASARIAARRQAAQKVQQRAATPLVTAEHYSYVRKDLVFIAILASIMFAIIILLHFVPGIGS